MKNQKNQETREETYYEDSSTSRGSKFNVFDKNLNLLKTINNRPKCLKEISRSELICSFYENNEQIGKSDYFILGNRIQGAAIDAIKKDAKLKRKSKILKY